MAPSVNSTLHPIVIPEIVVPPHFTCLGSGLLQSGHPRESPSSLQALLLPSAASPRGIPNSAKPKTWWRAQCLHYGIDMPVSATIERMRARLEEGLRGSGGLVLPGDILDLEHKKCGEFRKLNAQVRDKVSGGDSASGKAKAKPKGKSKDEPKEVVTTTTITTTTTTKRGSTAASSRGGSGAGAAKAAKTAKTAKTGSESRVAPMKTSGVSKPKPVVKPKKQVKKEVKTEEEDELYNYSRQEILRQQQQFLNTTNYTSPQGPLPSYLSQNRPRPIWQTQTAPTPEPERPRPTGNYARYSGPPRGGGNTGSSSGRPQWVPQGDGTFKQFGAPIGRGYQPRGGRSVSSTHQNHYPQPRQERREGEEGTPPPAYGSWLQNDNDDMGDNNSDYSDGAEVTAVRYEDFDVLYPGGSGGGVGQATAGNRVYEEEYGNDYDAEMGDIVDYVARPAEMQGHEEDELQAEMDLDGVMEDVHSNGSWDMHGGSDSEAGQNSDSDVSVWTAEASVQIFQ